MLLRTQTAAVERASHESMPSGDPRLSGTTNLGYPVRRSNAIRQAGIRNKSVMEKL
jgi:hypothetical protein